MSGFLDTNIIVRYLTGDGADLATRAAEIMDGADELILTEGVLAEVGYVLTKVYGVPRETAVDALVELVQRANIRPYIVDKGSMIQALLLCRPSGRVAFTDAFLWAIARSSNVRAVYTYDERFPSNGITVRRSLE